MTVRSLRVLEKRPSSVTRTLSATGATAVPTAVINFNFTNDTRQPWTKDAAGSVMFASASSVAAYYDEVTYGKLAVSGDVYGWFTIPYDNSGCLYSTSATAATTALAATGVDLSRYQKFVYAFPRASSCGWAGLGGGANAWLNGTISFRVAAREVGHALGLGHSKSMSCTESGARVTIVADVSTCSVSEYGDPFDVMGSASTRHTSNVGKAARGWMAGTRVLTVTAGGTYELAPAESPAGTAPQILRVQRADGAWLNLELRQPFGQYFDNFSWGDPVVNGVSIRWSSTTTSASPRLLDATPETTSFLDAPLAPGRSVSDTASGIRITTLFVSSTGASVQIDLGGGGGTPPPDTQPPTAPSPLSATAANETAASLSWPAATDDVGVASYRVFRNGALVATTTLRSDTDGGRTPGATYRYAVAAVDTPGNVGPSAEATLTMPTPPPPPAGDTTAPTAPTDLAATAGKGRKVSVSWGASTDDTAVAGYRLYRNGALLATVSGTGYTDTVGKRSTASYVVHAFDAAGNVSQPSNTATYGG